jgi:hypothetical protein
MMSTFIIGMSALIIAVIVVFSVSDLYSADPLRVAGYEQNNNNNSNEHNENSCGNGILPENIPCANVDSDAKGNENRVNINIEGIIFP